MSTLSESFYKNHLSQSTSINPLSDFIDIECADGQQLPYLGYIESNLAIDGVAAVKGIDNSIFLVVPDSRYNTSVPILLGTNILTELMSMASSSHGTRFLQSNITTPWYLSFRCLTLREKELKRNNYKLALVKSAESKNITIPPNSEVVIQGYLDKHLPYQPVCALFQSTDNSAIHHDLDIAPIITSYSYKNNGTIPVCISNITTRTVTVMPKATICELQPVTITDLPPIKPVMNEEISEDDFNIPKEDLTSEQLHTLKELLKKYKGLFSTSDTDIGHVTSVKHKIELYVNFSQ